ncbi:YidC/Oxa1 family membrane protein insertase [Caproicibacterium sp. NSD3]
MSQIFSAIGSVFGYVLWFLFSLVKNFGVAIILFTILVFAIQIPFYIKQQRSSVGMQKIQKKMKELQKIYANDKARLAEEQQKLYEKEGIKPTGGCLTMLLPLLIMMGLFYSFAMPLSNTLHIQSDHIAEIKSVADHVPGYQQTDAGFLGLNQFYGELKIVKNYDNVKGQLSTLTPEETEKLDSFSKGFSFIGMDLLDSPTSSSDFFGQLFHSNLFMIPLLCLILQICMQFFMNKMQPGMQQQMGCMKALMYGMAIYMAYLAAVIPAGVGLYYIVNSILNIGRMLLMNKYYSPEVMNSHVEASHLARMELNEAEKEPLPAEVQLQLAEKLERRMEAQKAKKKKTAAVSKDAQEKNSSGKLPAKTKSSNDYLGKRK